MITLLIGSLTGLTAITAIIGAVGMLAGLEDFPLSWLDGTPFHSFTIPALILFIMVGGSSLIATILVSKRSHLARRWSVIAGVILSAYILIEMLILNQEGPRPSGIEIFYLVMGILILILALFFRQPSFKPPYSEHYKNK